MNNEFILDLIGSLQQSSSKKQINSDIKQLEKAINMLRITGTFAKGNTKKELNAHIKSLQSQLGHVKLNAKIDSRNIKREVDNALKNISFKDIDLLNIDEGKVKLKIRKIIADAKSFAEKTPISVNIGSKKSKLDNDLTSYLNRNSKINESSVLLKEAEKVRELISVIDDKKSLREATDAFQLYKSQVSATGFATKGTADKIKDMLGHVTKISSAFGIASFAVNNFVKSMKTLKENDTILTEISKTSEMTKQQLKELGDEAFKVANKYGQSSGNYLLGVQEMARSGYEETSKALGELSLLAQSAGDMTADSANNYLLATDAAYKYSGSIEKLNAALDGANFISNRNSASLSDIADATRVSASFAANAGVAIDELTAAEATMLAVTKRGGSEIGRAFRSIVLNLQQVSGEFDGEVIDEEQLKKVEARCHSLGVELEYMKDGVPTLRNTMDVLRELAEVYNSLPDNSAEKQGLISDLGGKYHSNSLSALLSRWDLYEKMLGEFSQGTGSALEEANKTADSWEGRLNALSNSWTSFCNVLTNKEAIMGGISFFDRLIQGAEALTDTIGEIPLVLTTLNTALTTMKKDYGITQIVNPETNKLDIQGNMFGIDFTAIKEQKKHFSEAEAAIFQWNDKLISGKANLESFNSQVVKNNAQLKDYLSTTSIEAPASLSGYKAHLNAAGVSTDALRLKTILLNSAISMGLGIAIQAVVQGISYLIQREENLRQATEEAANAYQQSTSSISDYVSKYQELREALLAAKGNEEETYEVKKQLLDLQTELNDKFGEEYGRLNLVTDAYKDQTQAIKEFNKENANRFLNENYSGIEKAEKEMTGDKHYNLSGAYVNQNSKEGQLLKEIAEEYKDLGVTMNDGLDGTFSIHLRADAQSAHEVINDFMTDVKERAEQLGIDIQGNIDLSSVIEMSSSSLEDANEVIDKYGEIFRQAQMAQIAADASLTNGYNKAISAIEQYNEAILRSEDPYNDESVKRAWENLQEVRQGIIENESEWERYAGLMDEVFSAANDDIYSFYQAMQDDSGISKLTEELKGLSEIDLQSMYNDGNNGDAFDKLIAKAKEYGVELQDVIALLQKMGIVQQEVADAAPEMQPPSFTDTLSGIQSLSDGLDQLDKIYADVLDMEEFDWSSILNNEDFEKTFSNMANAPEEFADAYDEFIKTVSNSSGDIDACQEAFNNLASAYIYNSGVLDDVTESTKAATIAMLEQMGVANATEVVEAKLAETEARLAAEKQYLAQTGMELANATAVEIAEFINLGYASEDTRQYLYLLMCQKIDVNNIQINTANDVNQIIAIANAAGTATSYLQALGNALVNFRNMQFDTSAKTVKSGTGMNGKASKQGAVANAMSKVGQTVANVSARALENQIRNQLSVAVQKTQLNASDFYVAPAMNYTGGSASNKARENLAKAGSSPKSGSGKSSTTEKDTTKTYDWIEKAITRVKEAYERLQKVASSVYRVFTKRNSAFAKEVDNIRAQINLNQQAYAGYMQKANSVGLPDFYKNLVQNGGLRIEDITDETLQKQIEEYTEWYEKAIECADAVQELKEKLGDLAKERFDLINSEYESKLALIEKQASLIEANISKIETEAHIISQKYYETLMSIETQTLSKLTSERDELKRSLQEAIDTGHIDVGSEAFDDMQAEIMEVEKAIIESQEALVEFGNIIRELEWESFDRLQDQISQITDEADFLISLFEDGNLFDDSGNFNKEGWSTIGLHGVNYNTYMNQADQYEKELLAINKELAKDPYNTELLERRYELLEAQRDMISAAEDEKQAMRDLVKEGIDIQLDALQELIDKRKEALDAEKDLYDYQKRVAEQTKAIAQLEKQMEAYKGDTSEETRAQIQQIKVQLEEARENLKETEYEKYISDQEKMIDDLYD